MSSCRLPMTSSNQFSFPHRPHRHRHSLWTPQSAGLSVFYFWPTTTTSLLDSVAGDQSTPESKELYSGITAHPEHYRFAPLPHLSCNSHRHSNARWWTPLRPLGVVVSAALWRNVDWSCCYCFVAYYFVLTLWMWIHICDISVENLTFLDIDNSQQLDTY